MVAVVGLPGDVASTLRSLGAQVLGERPPIREVAPDALELSFRDGGAAEGEASAERANFYELVHQRTSQVEDEQRLEPESNQAFNTISEMQA